MLAAGLLAKKAVETGLQTQAVGQDQPGARLEGGHRLPDRGRADAARWSSCGSTWSATAARPASATAARCRQPVSKAIERRRPGRRRGAERQPQLRGPRPSRGAGQLPGLAAAGRRLRPGRPHGHRPAQRAARHGHARASRSSCATSGRRSRKCSDAIDKSRAARRCSARSTARSSRATSTGRRCRCRRATCSAGTPNRPTSSIRRTSRTWQPSRRR